jgi:hypothetical protein
MTAENAGAGQRAFTAGGQPVFATGAEGGGEPGDPPPRRACSGADIRFTAA